MELCPHCYAWRPHNEDRFCGHCGAPLLLVQVSVQPRFLYRDSGLPPELRVMVRHRRGELGGTRLVWHDQDGRLPDVPVVELTLHQLVEGGEIPVLLRSEQLQALGWQDRQLRHWQLLHWITDAKQPLLTTLHCYLATPKLVLDPTECNVVDGGEELALTILHQQGGVVEVQDIVPGSGDAVRLTLPAIDVSPALPKELIAGEQLSVKLRLSPELRDVLQNNPTGVVIELRLTLTDWSKPLVLPLRLRTPVPAKPYLLLPTLLDGKRLGVLRGRPLRLPVVVENRGGEACELAELRMEVKLGTQPLLSWPPASSSPTKRMLQPGESRWERLELPLQDASGQPLPARIYDCEITQAVPSLGPSQQPSIRFELEINPELAFSGNIAVDFGTTATAAAYYKFQGSPVSLALAGAEHYLPTAIAYFLNKEGVREYRIGREAQELLAQPAAGNIRYFDNIKWRLGDPRPVLLPDGQQCSWVDVAADYLREIKTRIEEHPAITALVDEVCVTQPARFDPLMSRNLQEAYRKAGFAPRRITVGGGLQDFFSESWSSVVLRLPLPALQSWQEAAIGPVSGSSIVDQMVAVLSYDIGGGSTDISLLSLNVQDLAHITIRELATDGTNSVEQFCGNGFANCLFRHLWPSCEVWLRRNGYDPRQFPVSLPWEPVGFTVEQQVARENGRRLMEIIQRLQDNQGPFFDVVSGGDKEIWDDLKAEDKKKLGVDLTEKIEKKTDRIFNDVTLALQSLPGGTVSIPYGKAGAGFCLACAEFLDSFVEKLARPMYSRLEAVLNYQELQKRELYCLLTGRGSLFPLVTPMLAAHLKRLRDPSNYHILRVGGEHLKTIVCQGTCYLEEHLLSSSEIRFEPRRPPSIGIAMGINEIGRKRFVPLCVGLPQPGYGYAQPYQVAAGAEVRVRILMYMNVDNTNYIGERDRHLGMVEAQVTLTPPEASRAQLLVHAETVDCLHCYIAVPPAGSSSQLSEGEWDQYAEWEKQPLGYVELIEGSCPKRLLKLQGLTPTVSVPDAS